MKKIITLVIVAFITVNVTAQEINWVSLEEALELQKKNPKKIMMDVYTNWCGPCKKLDKYTFGNKDVAEYINKHYYAVKFNGEGNEKIRYNDKDFENPNYKPSEDVIEDAVQTLAGKLKACRNTYIYFNSDKWKSAG